MATAPHTKVSRPKKSKKPRYEPILDLPLLPCGRRFLGIEREERYVRITLERLGR